MTKIKEDMELDDKKHLDKLIYKIKNSTARVGVIGLGYVGLPVALRFCEEGFKVTGFDVDPGKVESIRKGESYIKHIPFDSLMGCIDKGKFEATTDMSKIREADAVIICVPTPLKHGTREPDMSHVESVAREVSKYLREGQLVSLESTTYPGTTEELVLPVLEKTGLKAGRDFFLVYSPEREDPGRRNFTTKTTPKVVGGLTPKCLEAGRALYSRIVDSVVSVSSTKAAEMAKLLENIYRSVNIALINELKMLADRMGIDIWEVIDVAKTKPFGFQAFYPGPGLGGHCIPIDPFYLTWKARQFDFSTKFIELAGEINTNMPYYVVGKVSDALNGAGKAVKGSKVLVLGVAYKKDIDDLRESPALPIIDILKGKGALVDYHDPYVPELQRMRTHGLKMESMELTEENIKGYDCVLIVTDHSSYEFDWIVENSMLVVDSRGATKDIESEKIVKA